MKTFIIIFLISVLTCPFWGTYSYFQFERKRARMEVNRKFAAGLDKTQLILLKFTQEETQTILTWKHSREFVYKGQMYDIVDQRQEGDSVFYTCYKDDKETRLNLEKKRVVAKALGQDPLQKNQKERIKSFFKTIYQHEIDAWKPNLIQPCIIHYALNLKHYSLFSESPPSPPPKCV